MKNLKNIILASVLSLSLGAIAFGAFSGGSATLLAGSSNQFDEGDVGSIIRDGSLFLAGSSNQFDEGDVGSIQRDGTVFFAGSSNQFDEGDVG